MRQRRATEPSEVQCYDGGPEPPDDKTSSSRKPSDAWTQMATERGNAILIIARAMGNLGSLVAQAWRSKSQACQYLMLLLLLVAVWMLKAIILSNNRGEANIQVSPIRLSSDSYDVLNCPETPPAGYPREYPILDVLRNWNPNSVVPPQQVYQGICVFDVSLANNITLMRQQILNYRVAEVPFVVRNDKAVRQAVKLWKTPDYLSSKLKGKLFQATLSNTTIMTYYSTDPENNVVPEAFVPFTRNVPMSFDDWNNRAHGSIQDNFHEKYAYLRLDACLPDQKCDSSYRGDPQLGNADFMYQDLSFLHPNPKHQPATSVVPSVMNGNGPRNQSSSPASKARGVQCRMGTPGLTAEDHFDNERNTLVMLRGARRYLLGHPSNCPTMYLYPPKHPLERHSRVDWTTIVNATDSFKHTDFPNFTNTTINEVVLQEGDILYLPTYWFHHIISLTVNYQCNTRSGYSVEYDQTIYDCGFFYDFPS